MRERKNWKKKTKKQFYKAKKKKTDELDSQYVGARLRGSYKWNDENKVNN